ncbi:MAG TPA: DsbA family oxidoreductase [Candidatus Thermoplasmatota archaeon]|nr:DsbA family oxidoreductase [Candidatus Thermoplasmatota archaeon]
MRIDVWADVVCPWCAIGHHRLHSALREAGIAAEVVPRAFQLEPQRGAPQPSRDALRRKYGPSADAMMRHVRELAAADGLELRTEEAVSANTFDAHRLVALARRAGKGPAMLDRLFQAHFREGRDVSDAATLGALAGEVGLPGGDVAALLQGRDGAPEVEHDVAEARRMGVSGVPFFVFDGRVALSGAQSMDVFRRTLAELSGGTSAGR